MQMECGLAKHRISIGTNANIEHGGASGGSSKEDGNETKLAMVQPSVPLPVSLCVCV